METDRAPGDSAVDAGDAGPRDRVGGAGGSAAAAVRRRARRRAIHPGDRHVRHREAHAGRGRRLSGAGVDALRPGPGPRTGGHRAGSAPRHPDAGSNAPLPVLVLGRRNGGQTWMDEATGTEVLSRGPAGPTRWWWHVRRASHSRRPGLTPRRRSRRTVRSPPARTHSFERAPPLHWPIGIPRNSTRIRGWIPTGSRFQPRRRECTRTRWQWTRRVGRRSMTRSRPKSKAT